MKANRLEILLCCFLVVIVFTVFYPALQGAFLYFDENSYLIQNRDVNRGLSVSGILWAFKDISHSNWCPLVWISHMVDWGIYGAKPWGHHLTNLFIHAANTILLFLALNKMTGALWRSFIVAALFSVHPLRTESVAWISERKDMLSGFFGLLSLYTYVFYAKTGVRKFYGFTLLFFICSLMSKAMLVTFPFLLLLLDYWPLHREEKRSDLLIEKIPFLLAIIPVSIVAYFAERSGNSLVLHPSWDMRFETVIIGYLRYLGKMFWPTDLAVLYPYPDSWPAGIWAAALVLFASISLFVFAFRRYCYLPVGWLWFVGTLVPVIGIVQEGPQSFANRYTYIPMIGILIAFIWGIAGLTKNWPKLITASAFVLVMAVLSFRSHAESLYWKDDVSLWTHTLAVTKNNYAAHNCFGFYLLEDRFDNAFTNFEAAVEIKPDYADAQRNLAVAFLKKSNLDACIEHAKIASQLEPATAQLEFIYGEALSLKGDFGSAIAHLEKAITLDAGNVDYQFALAINLNNLAWNLATDPETEHRNGKRALELVTRACQITPHPQAHFFGTLAAADAENGKFEEAISNVQEAIALAESSGQMDLLQKEQQLLELYRLHHPYHEAH